MTDYNEQVYRIVARIPRGKVVTYGQIAAMLGNPLAARRVGHALHNTPPSLRLPCHRVVNQKGEMLGGIAFGGADAQRQLLRNEGVIFKSNGCINLAQSRWMLD